MTRREAKQELRPIKDMESDIRSVEQEIERLMTVATKMTPNYGPSGSPSHKNKLEEAIVQIEDYRLRLTSLVRDSLDKKNRCLNKVAQIQPASLRKILILYYFQDMTLEKVAEAIDKSPRWTYTMFNVALDEYAKIS